MLGHISKLVHMKFVLCSTVQDPWLRHQKSWNKKEGMKNRLQKYTVVYRFLVLHLYSKWHSLLACCKCKYVLHSQGNASALTPQNYYLQTTFGSQHIVWHAEKTFFLLHNCGLIQMKQSVVALYTSTLCTALYCTLEPESFYYLLILTCIILA